MDPSGVAHSSIEANYAPSPSGLEGERASRGSVLWANLAICRNTRVAAAFAAVAAHTNPKGERGNRWRNPRLRFGFVSVLRVEVVCATQS